MSILKAIESTRWAITEEGLRTVIAIASREGSTKALESKLGDRPKYAYRARIRDRVGVIPITGPLFRRANLFTEISGATSYDLVMRDFHSFVESDDCDAIILNIDSPGGEVNGCQELADHIYKARGDKPIIAYVGGIGASAAYWIASSCDEIVAAETAILGSIGVQSVINADKREGELTFVSSQSPLKNADPRKEEGAREVQRLIDSLGSIFIDKVARNRSVKVDTVLKDFGQGAVFVASDSLNRKMIDRISNFEDLMSETKTKSKVAPTEEAEAALTVASLKASHPNLVKEISAKAILAERNRAINLFNACAAHVDHKTMASYLEKGVSAEKAALEILNSGSAKKKDAKAEALSSLEEDESELSGLSSSNVDAEDDWSFEMDLLEKTGDINCV